MPKLLLWRKISQIKVENNLKEIVNKNRQIERQKLMLNSLISQYREFTRFSQFKNLDNNHFQIINDLVYPLKIEQEDCWKKIQSTLLFPIIYFNNLIPVITPDSKGLIIWDLLNCMVLCSNFFLIPYEIVFNLENFIYIKFFTINILTIDILANFFKARYYHTQLITEKSQIFKLNMDIKLLINILLVFVYSASIENPELKLVIFIKLYDFQSQMGGISLHFRERFPSIMHILNLIFNVIIIAHQFACLWYLVTSSEYDQSEDNHWFHQQKILQQTYFERYIYSLYFVIISMCTVGYGDIVPITTNQTVFSMIMVFIGSGIFAYAVNTVGSIFLQKANQKKLIMKQKYLLSHYLRTRNISSQLQYKILQNLEESMESQKLGNAQGKHILEKYILPDLKNDFNMEYQAKIIKEIPFFKNNFSQIFNEEISKHFSQENYTHNGVILQNDQKQTKLVYIHLGQAFENLSLGVSRQKNLEVKVHQPGSLLGLSGFTIEKQRNSQIQSNGISLILQIERDLFLEVIKRPQFTNDFEKFSKLKDDMVFNYPKIEEVECSSCQSKNHGLITCPQISLQLNQLKIIDQSMKSQVHTSRQRKFKRKPLSFNANGVNLSQSNGKTNALFVLLDNQLYIKDFQEELVADVLHNLAIDDQIKIYQQIFTEDGRMIHEEIPNMQFSNIGSLQFVQDQQNNDSAQQVVEDQSPVESNEISSPLSSTNLIDNNPLSCIKENNNPNSNTGFQHSNGTNDEQKANQTQAYKRTSTEDFIRQLDFAQGEELMVRKSSFIMNRVQTVSDPMKRESFMITQNSREILNEYEQQVQDKIREENDENNKQDNESNQDQKEGSAIFDEGKVQNLVYNDEKNQLRIKNPSMSSEKRRNLKIEERISNNNNTINNNHNNNNNGINNNNNNITIHRFQGRRMTVHRTILQPSMRRKDISFNNSKINEDSFFVDSNSFSHLKQCDQWKIFKYYYPSHNINQILANKNQNQSTQQSPTQKW